MLDYLNYLNLQEKLIPILSDKALWLQFISGLRAELYKSLMAYATLGKTRAEVVTQTQLMEESLLEERRGVLAAPQQSYAAQGARGRQRSPIQLVTAKSEGKTTSYKVTQRA